MSGRSAVGIAMALGVSAIAGVAGAGAAVAKPGCALKGGVVMLVLDEKAGTVAVAKAGKKFVMKRGDGAEVVVDLAKLDLPTGKADRYVGWDCSRKQFIPPFASPLRVPMGSRPKYKVNIRPLEARPQLIAGAKGVLSVQWDGKTKTLSGKSKVKANEPKPLRITAPPTPKSWRLVVADLSKDDWKAGVVPEPWQAGPWAGIILRSPADRVVAWRAVFETGPPRREEAKVHNLRVVSASDKAVRVCWDSEAGYFLVCRNDEAPIGVTTASYTDRTVRPETTYTYSVSALSWSGRSKAEASVSAKTPPGPPPPPEPDVHVVGLKAVKSTVGWNDYARKNKSIEDNPLRIAGREYAKGMGVHAHSELVYEIEPEYERFIALVGVDDEKGPGQGSVVFEVYADKKRLYRSKVMRGGQEAEQINVAIPPGSRHLRLVVTDARDGIGSDHADWVYAGFVRKKPQKEKK